MTDWYDTHTISPDAVSAEEYRDWVAENVGPEEAADFWYGPEAAREAVRQARGHDAAPQTPITFARPDYAPEGGAS